MRCFYREKIIRAGDYLQVDIYPVFAKAGARRKRRKPTSEAQQRLNEKNSREKLIHILNANFTEQDIKFDPTYTDEYLPEDDNEDKRLFQNFIRRLKAYRKKHGLPELKYVDVLEKSRNGRYHHHMVMSGGVPLADLQKLWKMGRVGVSPLDFDEHGLTCLALYITKDPVRYRRYNGSRNLVVPEPETKDGRLPQKKVNELAGLADCAKEFEALYPGYSFADCAPFYNDYNKHQYLTVRMYRDPRRKYPKRKE